MCGKKLFPNYHLQVYTPVVNPRPRRNNYRELDRQHCECKNYPGADIDSDDIPVVAIFALILTKDKKSKRNPMWT